ncbi:MAG: SusC/RagA family TonB-linked outer membrane protein, partial [Balneolaceae bacterium]|nr:SusC/RagA family TonB-linked outer membrane protein [Balneolaceae bacterium]
PLLEPYYPDGSFAVVYNVGNPLANLEYSNNYNRGVRIVGNVFGEFSFFEDFLFRSSFGTDAALNRAENFTPAFTVLNPDGTESQQNNEYSDLFKGETLNYNLLWENTVNYIKDYDKHTINAVVGLTMQQIKSEILELSGQNIIRNGNDFWYIQPSYIIDEANNINTLSSISNRVDANQYFTMMSYLGRVVYSYDDKYTATLTLRRDGSSKFSEENRWGTFPSVAVGWNLDREAFMENVTLIDNLKLRGSWGQIGNEKIAYYDRFARVDADLLAVFGNPDATFNAATFGKSGNPDLRWEATTQTDIGLEVGLLGRRLTGEFDFYNRVTDDILVELATPGHLGNGQGQRVRYNAGSVLNRGIEFRVNWEDYIGDDFSYGVTVLGNTIHNEVQDIGGNSEVDDELIGGALANGQRVTRSVVGRPIGSFYGYKTDGIFQNQGELDNYPHMSLAGVGDLRFVDTNGDGEISGDDRTYIGSPIPDLVYGFSFEVGYKNWDLAVDFQGQYGNEIFNGKNVVRPDPYNFEQHVFDRWTGEGTSNTEPRPSYGGYNFLPSDRFIQDGSYLRLRSINLGYSLPAELVNKMNMTRARIYVKGNNLFTWTGYSGYTPEIGSGDVLSNGIDTGIYPIPRVVSIGINTTF